MSQTAYPIQIDTTVKNAPLQKAIYTATGRLVEMRRNAVALAPQFEELRAQANRVKQHTIEHLDHYLEQVEKNVEANGGKVVFARTGEEVADFILSLAKQKGAKLFVKSKSMTSEEIHLNSRLEAHQLEAVETDLGEYILQLADERPYHIIAPALHYTRYDVAKIFGEKLGRTETDPGDQAMIARAVLRQKFLDADIGITGANFVVADSGAVVVVENEGNARLTHSAPKIHIAIAGIEKLIPRAQDLAVFLALLGRSATGQPMSVYTSFVGGPKRSNEIDGPDEFYLILLDNGRTKVLANEQKRQSLYCIRCGACLNHCPVYRKIGGHNYPWVYSGPIGAILTPQFHGHEKDPWLPFASSLCGACAEVCPVKIDIPQVLLELRRDVVDAKTAAGSNRLEKLTFRMWAWAMKRPKMYERLAKAAAIGAPLGDEKTGWIRELPGFLAPGPVKGWLAERDLPRPAKKSFRELWRERQKKAGKPS